MRLRGYGIEQTCKVLADYGIKFSPRGYRAARGRALSERDRMDQQIINVLEELHLLDDKGRKRPETLYGARKMWRYLQRNGFPEVARCTVERLMRHLGMQGMVRGKAQRTTIPGKDGKRAGDLLNRNFDTDAPNEVWVTDFTYVRTWAGFVYVALVIDLYARKIVGWSASTTMDTMFVEEALHMAIWTRAQQGHHLQTGPHLAQEDRTIHHSDAGSQYTSLRYTETIDLEGLRPSIGTVGDAYDNAQAESVMGLFKNEAVRKDSPFRVGPLKTVTDVEDLTLAWVTWYNQDRLHSTIDYQTPSEAEQQYHQESSRHGVAA